MMAGVPPPVTPMITANWNTILGQRLERFPLFATGNEKRRETSCHRQIGLELNLTGEGRGVLAVEGVDVPVMRGTLVIVPEGATHQLKAQPPYTRSVLCLASDQLARRCPGLWEKLLSGTAFQRMHQVTLSEASTQLFQERVARIAEEMTLQAENWEEACLALALETAVLAARAVRSSSFRQQPAPDSARQPRQVADYINRRLDEDLSTEAVAAEFGISREHLSRLFTREFGVPFHRYVMAMRLQAAQHLLVAKPGDNLLDIALASGFQSHAHFSRCFKKKVGMTPSQYRSLHHIG